VADRAGWQDVVESELRAAGRELEVPPASDLAAAVRQRLEGQAVRHRRMPGPEPAAVGWRGVPRWSW